MRLAFLLAVALVGSRASYAAEPVEIPLKDVWAYLMRDTRDIQELSKEDFGAIYDKLGIRTEQRAKAGLCFIVLGDAKEALRKAKEVIVDGAKALKTLPAGKGAWLVFYSYAAPGYVILDSVLQSDRQVTVQYQVVLHMESNVTQHVALIPLGELTAGDLKVEIAEGEPETPYENHALTKRSVCGTCTFVVEGE